MDERPADHDQPAHDFDAVAYALAYQFGIAVGVSHEQAVAHAYESATAAHDDKGYLHIARVARVAWSLNVSRFTITTGVSAGPSISSWICSGVGRMAMAHLS